MSWMPQADWSWSSHHPMVDMHRRFIHYVIQPGDTLFFLAQRYGTTVDRILRHNCIPNPDLIYPGQIIIIPCPGRPGQMMMDP